MQRVGSICGQRHWTSSRKGWPPGNVLREKPALADSLSKGEPLSGGKKYKGGCCRNRSEASGQSVTLGSVGDSSTALEGEGPEESRSWGSGRHTPPLCRPRSLSFLSPTTQTFELKGALVIHVPRRPGQEKEEETERYQSCFLSWVE